MTAATRRSERFGPERRLTRPEEFRRVYAQGKACPTPRFVCHALDRGDPDQPSRLGITASKRTGRAHDRNRCKRWTREVFRRESLRGGVDIVVTFRGSVALADFEQFGSALREAFRKLCLYEP